MFGLTQLSALSLLALSAVAQDNAAASATSMVASADPAQSGGNVAPSASAAGPATSGGAVEDGPDGNDVTPESGGTNPGWNTTYFYAPSNSKAYGFWVNGIENRAIWNPVNITTRLVLTNSRKDFWAGEKELQTNSEYTWRPARAVRRGGALPLRTRPSSSPSVAAGAPSCTLADWQERLALLR